MADKMFLIVTLRREVPNKESAKAMVEIIKNKLTDYPTVTITSHITDHLDIDGIPT